MHNTKGLQLHASSVIWYRTFEALLGKTEK
jgi:hypothetical protein